MSEILNIFYIDSRLVYVLLVFTTCDVITGVLKATQSHSLRSAISRKGTYKKYLMVLCVEMAWVLDKCFFTVDLTYTITATFFIASESLSIIENLGELGIPIPRKLKNAIQSLKDDSDKDD